MLSQIRIIFAKNLEIREIETVFGQSIVEESDSQ